jgi:hypothetical protein
MSFRRQTLRLGIAIGVSCASIHLASPTLPAHGDGPSLPARTEPPIELYLGEAGRFRVRASWRVSADFSPGRATPLTPDTGDFWFFRDSNLELVTKVLDACSFADRFWFFAGGLTNVEVNLAVEDTHAETSIFYHNPQGTPFQPIQDTGYFATCAAAARACGRGTPGEIAATPRADAGAELLALVLGGRLTADPALYERTRADLAAIRELEPEVADIDFVSAIEPHTLIVGLTDEAASAARQGNYHAWDCLNAWYGASVRVLSANPIAFIDLSGLFHPDLLIPDYRTLPGIEGVGADIRYRLMRSPLINLCATVRGKEYDYFFQKEAKIWYFVSSGPSASPTLVDVLNAAPPPPGSEPDWFPRYQHCSQYWPETASI